MTEGAPPARTLVIIPAYNEEDSLPAVLKELREQTPEHDVLVVSDGSTDRTADVARAAGAFVAVLLSGVVFGILNGHLAVWTAVGAALGAVLAGRERNRVMT